MDCCSPSSCEHLLHSLPLALPIGVAERQREEQPAEAKRDSALVHFGSVTPPVLHHLLLTFDEDPPRIDVERVERHGSGISGRKPSSEVANLHRKHLWKSMPAFPLCLEWLRRTWCWLRCSVDHTCFLYCLVLVSRTVDDRTPRDIAPLQSTSINTLPIG